MCIRDSACAATAVAASAMATASRVQIALMMPPLGGSTSPRGCGSTPCQALPRVGSAQLEGQAQDLVAGANGGPRCAAHARLARDDGEVAGRAVVDAELALSVLSLI